MKKILTFLFVLASLSSYAQINLFGGVGMRVNDSSAYVNSAAVIAAHLNGYADQFFSNSTNLWWKWNGSAYELLSSGGDTGLFWRSTGTTTLTGNTTIDGDASNLTLTDIGQFNVNAASMDWEFSGASLFEAAGGFLWSTPDQPLEFTAGANAFLRINDSGNGQSILSGDGTGGVIVASPDAGLHIDLGTNDVRVFASDDIDLDPTDDLLIDGASGTTGQFIGNTNGHPAWTTPFNSLIEDEATPVTQRSTINFTGAGVSVADTGGKTTVTISGGGGGGYDTVEDETTPLTQRTTINFAGAGVTATDSGGETLVTISGGTGHSYQFNVVDYGATGDGTTDDTGAFQDAFDAACAVDGDVIIPPASVAYRLNSTVEVHPCSGGQIWVDVKAYGDAAEIKFYGADNTAAFEIWGLKGARWDGMNVEIVTGCVGCVAFDIDTDAAASSTSNNTFANMRIHLGGSAAGGTADLRNEDCIGIRTGLVSGGNGDVSHYIFENVSVYGGGDSSGSPNVPCAGQYAFQNLGANVLSNVWLGGFVAQCERAYSNISADGTDRGNAAISFFGFGGSGNDIDFVFAWEQTYNIEGGRFESGNAFLHIPNNGNYPQVTIQDISIRGYKVSTELMLVERSSSLVLDNVHVYSATPFTGMINITANHHSDRMGVLSITNSAFEMGSTVPYPFVKTGQVPLAARLSNNVRLSAGLAASYFLNLDLPGSGLDIENTQVGNVTTGEDQLYSYTLIGGALYQDEMFVRMRFSGSFANNGNTKTLRVKFGGTTMITRTLTTPTNGTGWSCECEVYRTGAATQDYNCTFVGLDPAADASNVGTAGETLSGDVAITVTGDATATDDITKHTARVNFND